jgi:plasmid maintenance system killer protein
MIESFANKDTEEFFRRGSCPAQWRAFANVAKRKLDMIDAAVRLSGTASTAFA